MPVSSHQISQMVAGQQAMFGNAATYAHQISPMGRAMGAAPTYANPYGPMAMPGAADYNAGVAAAPGLMNAAASYGAPIMMGAGMMMGGRIGSMLDPFTAGMRGFGAGVGWQSGAGLGHNLGIMARGGIGGLARGVGMAGLAAAPVMAMYSAGKYALGQMAEGAQFQNSVNTSLQNNFRFTNDQSSTGYGFGHVEQQQIGRMLHTMGTQDMMSTPQEMLGIMNKGASMGVFRGVQDAREFKQKFTAMKESLKEIASTFNTTLSEALPFFQQARQQGFWTPQDITRHTNQVRQVQANTGMSAQQAQVVMGMGAQMVRGIGGTGQQGSEMMARAQMLSGSALFGGVVNGRMLANAGFGTGAEGAQNLGNMLAGATARFARSRVGRWTLAGLMGEDGNLDTAGVQAMASGAVGVRDIGRRARRNVSGGRAYDFVMNEGDLRGQLAQQGPEAALGIVRSLVGGRLHGDTGRDRLVTRRIIQRFMGGNARQADIVAKLAREMPRMMQIQAARSEGSLDAQDRQRDQMMNDTYEGFKRRIGQWWREKIDAPLQEAGAAFSYRVGKTWERFQDRLFGTGGRSVGLSAEAVRSMVRSAETGNMSYMRSSFGTSGDMDRYMGGGGFTGGHVGSAGSDMNRLGFGGQRDIASAVAGGSGLGGSLWNAMFSRGDRFSAGDIREAGALVRGSRGVIGDEEAAALGFDGAGAMSDALGGAGAKQIQDYLKTGEALSFRGAFGNRLSGAGRERYAENLVSRIRAGRAGEQAQQLFSGLNRRQAIARVMAMSGGGFTGTGSLGRVGDFSGQNLRERIENMQIADTEDLAKLMRGGESDSIFSSGVRAAASGGIAGVAVTEQGIEEIKKDPRGEQALSLFAEAESMKESGASPEEVEAKKQRARELMAELGNDDSGASAAARSAAIRMANASDPQADAIASMAGRMGAGMGVANRAAFDRKIKGRRRRMLERLGNDGRRRLEQLAGGEGSTFGKALKDALSTQGTGAGGMLDPKQYVNQMSALAKAAAEDPDRANRMLAELREKGLGSTGMAVTLEGAMRVQHTAKKMGLSEDIGEDDRITQRARRGISMRLQQLGIKGIKGKALDEIIRGGDVSALREQLKAQNYKDSDIDTMVNRMRGGLTKDELIETGSRHAAARGITTLDEKVAKRAGLSPDELTGVFEKGDTSTVRELKVHTRYFQKIHDVLLATNRGDKVPVKDKKTK